MIIGYRVVHAGFGFEGSAAPVSELEKLFAKVAAEWTRYGQHCWLLYTNRSLESLTDSIRESAGQGEFLLCEVEPGSYSGCLRDGVSRWLQRLN
jgi:hypothetical protein